MSSAQASKMIGTDFTDLLQSAEQLTAEFELSDFADLPRVERNLTQLVEAGQQLFSKTSRDLGGQDVKAAILLGSRGVDLPGLQQQLQCLSSDARQGQSGGAFEPLEPLRDTDIAGFLRNERENALLSVIEETRKETFDYVEKLHWEAMSSEWETDKQRILQALGGGSSAVTVGGTDLADLSRSLRPEASRIHETTLGTRSALDNIEIVYANEVIIYNAAITAGGTKPNLVDKFSAMFPEDKDQEGAILWEMVKSMDGLSVPTGGAQAGKWRENDVIKKSIVQMSKSYLEGAFKKFVNATVFSNLQQAQLGGIPGTYHLIRSFLNIKVPSNSPGLEDGLIDGVPVWAMIYYSLRCGDYTAAIQSASQAGPGLSEILKLLSEVSSSPDRRLTPHSENVVRLSYRRSVRATSDPFKRAIYCLLGACDPADEHSEIANSLDDYLWIKLYQIREGTALDSSLSGGHVDSLSLCQLQTLLSEEYGESHFNAYEQPVLYFQVLFLTGQFEAAVEFLFRIDRLRAHAVHITLALFERNALLLTSNIQAGILTKEAGDKAPTKRLNVARMVMLYVRRFESTDPKESLQYFYFLRNLRGARNENLFMSCVSELVLESREFDLLLGHLNTDGTRSPGMIDRLQTSPSETQKVIENVAQDSEQKGMFEDSIRLYDLARKHERVIELLNKLLAQVISQPALGESRRDRLQRQAVSIAKRYRTLGHTASAESTASFYLLLDLMTFFDLFHAKKFDDAIDIIGKVKIIPLSQSEIDTMVANFRALPDEIRRNIPDVLLACMSILFSQYKQTKGTLAGRGVGQDGGKKRQLETLRDKAKSMITFAGMIPYRMPGDTNARLVQMEVLMN